MLPVVHRGQIPPIGRVIEVLLRAAGREDQRRSDPPSVGRLSLELYFQVVMGVVLRLDVLVDGRGPVDIVDHQREPAVVVEIGVRRAIREARLVHSPFGRLVGKRQIGIVAEDIIGQPVAVELLQESQGTLVVSGSACTEHRGLVVEIVGGFGVPVADEDVLIAIVVEIAEQGAPAPIGARHAREPSHVAEDHVPVRRDAVAQLQRVDVVRVAKPPATEIEATAIGEIPAHAFLPLERGREHVHLEDVGPAVVIEVGDIDAHARKARVLEPGTGLVGERSVPVIDVEDIVGCDVVGDVDIGPAVVVHVRHHHPESVSDLLQDPRLPGYIREGPIAVVAIELVVAFRAAALDAERVRVRHATGKVLGGIVEQKEVEAAIPVVIEEHGVGGETRIGDAVACRGLGERAVAVIDEQQVGPVLSFGALGPGDGDVDVQIPVVIDVHHGGAGGPPVRGDPRRLRDVFEPHAARVPVQPARDHVAAEENVRQSVVIDVSDRYARAVVYVGLGLHVHGIVGGDGVRERDPGSCRGQELEQWAIGSFGPAPSDGEQGDDEGAAHEGG